MHKAHDGIGEHGELVPGPPWILGHRGSPSEAPENTLVGLRRAIDLGLDGVEYDLHACSSGEPVLIHDETLDRTTDARGRVADLTLPELTGLDAGGWFHRSFVGEPLPLLEEALELPGNRAGTAPQHMIELKDPTLVSEVVRQIRERARTLSVRIASFHRSVCLEARDLGMPTMLLGYEANEADRLFVRDERITAFGTAPGGWDVPAGSAEWDCEKWSWSVDDPDDLLRACRRPLFGFNTNYPQRALSIRALAFLTPDDEEPYPLQVDPLEVPVLDDPGTHGEWAGRWSTKLELRNPFPFSAAIAVGLAIRGGAFERQGLPVAVKLDPRASVTIPFELAGGSWSPAEDPVIQARFLWRRGPGRPEESLVLERPLVRVRSFRLRDDATRVSMLRETPGARAASMSVYRRRGELIARVENAGGMTDVRAIVRLGDRVRKGGQGVRIPLGEVGAEKEQALRFALGFEGREADGGRRKLRRWCGGLPYGLGSGAPGRLVRG